MTNSVIRTSRFLTKQGKMVKIETVFETESLQDILKLNSEKFQIVHFKPKLSFLRENYKKNH